jgi:chemotaxis protein CheC
MVDVDSLRLDALKEISNIGSGNAVATLSRMCGLNIRMSVPVIKALEYDQIQDLIGGPENIISAALINIRGDLDGLMMFLMGVSSARALVEEISKRKLRDDEELSDMDYSILEETGNIVASSYINAISDITNKRILPSAPSVCIDMACAILSVPFIQYQNIQDKALFIKSVFKTSENDAISGYFILFLDSPTTQKIVSELEYEGRK